MNARAAAIARLRPWIERARGFSGWDLRAVAPRLLEAGPPWSYAALAREYGKSAAAALDMGTGGGEVLAELRPALPARLFATEAWPPNLPLAGRRLRPLGVAVIGAASLRLPLRDRAFDLILNRHEELDPAEIARLLRPGGRIVTQQAGSGEHWQELRPHFPRLRDYGGLFNEYQRGLKAAGLRLHDAREHDYRVAYPSLGELVYLLAIMPWTALRFDLESDLEALLALESACLGADGLVLTESRFLIVAEKPA